MSFVQLICSQNRSNPRSQSSLFTVSQNGQKISDEKTQDK